MHCATIEEVGDLLTVFESRDFRIWTPRVSDLGCSTITTADDVALRAQQHRCYEHACTKREVLHGGFQENPFGRSFILVAGDKKVYLADRIVADENIVRIAISPAGFNRDDRQDHPT